MAIINFEMIQDSRFKDNKNINILIHETDEALKRLGAEFTKSDIIDLIFDDKDKKVIQSRVEYNVIKSRLFTYKQLYETINRVKAVYYKIIY